MVALSKKEEYLEENASLSFDEVYKLYGKKIINLAYKMTSNEETARDLTQDIFIKVYTNFNSYKGESHIYTWIYRIAVNHILNYLKKERKRKFFNILDRKVSDFINQKQEELAFLQVRKDQSPEKILENSEREKIIWSIIQTISPTYRVPLILFRYEELSYQEIAETMNIGLSAVETRLHRAKKELINKLKPWLKEI